MHVYKITNTINGKVYIGKSVKKEGRRERAHFSMALRGHSQCPHFHRAIRKYGRNSFLVETLATADTVESLCEKEVYLIAQYQSSNPEFGYNLSLGGEGHSRVKQRESRECPTCKTGFEVIPTSAKVFCSRICANTGREDVQPLAVVLCQYCGSEFQSREPKLFCSRACSNKGRDYSTRPKITPSEETRQKMSESRLRWLGREPRNGRFR